MKIDAYKKLKKVIYSDLKRYGYKKIINCFMRIPGFRFSVYLRITQYLKHVNKYLFIISKFFLRRMAYKYGMDIYETTDIGYGFYIGHFGGIVISSSAVIGNNVNISQGITIGAISKGKNKGAPIIGDRVWIGANSVIVGNITIGKGSAICPGSFVNFDVPENCLVMGNPASVIKEDYENKYIVNSYE